MSLMFNNIEVCIFAKLIDYDNNLITPHWKRYLVKVKDLIRKIHSKG